MYMPTRLALPALLLLAVACNPKPQPEQPVPVPATQPATPAFNADSARQAQEVADQARRHADSLAAAARDSAARAAAGASAAARAEAERMFTDQIHFDYDVADIRAEDQALLDWKARLLLANPAMTIRISGHADERGSDEYNLALGNRRAAAAKRYLVNKGVAEGRIVTDSYGEEQPLDPASTEEAYAKNRRDEFAITASPATWSLPTP